MSVMAQKKPSKPDQRTGSRHKPRRMISFRPSIYEALAKLAEQNHRPVAWEAELAIIKALTEAGLLPPADPPTD